MYVRLIAPTLVLCGVLASFLPAIAADQTPESIFERSRPATLMIVAHFQAKASVPEATFPEDKAALLHQRLATLLQQGRIARTNSDIESAAAQIILGDPLTFLVPGDRMETRDAGFTSIGTGWIVSPDGYVVTNAHVAAPNRDEIEQQLVTIGLHDLVEHEVADINRQLAGIFGADVAAQYHDLAVACMQKFDRNYLTLSNETHTFDAVEGATGSGSVAFHSFSAEVTASVGSEIPGKDVAILKLEGSDFPTLAVGDDTALAVGDRLYVMGYPGAATFHPLLADGAAAQTEPTFTAGIVSARKPMQGGWSVIQTDAATTHGNSGGPVFDSTGKVVGILTFASADANTGAEVQGFNFIVPISIVREFLDRANVRPGRSLFNDTYDAALASYHEAHYRKAIDLFSQIDRLSPGHPYVGQYIALSQTAVDEGRDRWWIAGWWPGIAGLLIACIVGYVVRRRVRLRRPPTAKVRVLPN